MKNFLILSAALMLLATAACKRNYSCACTVHPGLLGPPTLLKRTDTITIEHTTRNQAEKDCAVIKEESNWYSCELL